MPANLTAPCLPVHASRPASPLANINLAVMRLLETAERWAARREQRRALLALSDHQLHDIGVSRLDVVFEASKPFWRT